MQTEYLPLAAWLNQATQPAALAGSNIGLVIGAALIVAIIIGSVLWNIRRRK